MNNVTTATSFPSLCRHDCQHGQKCEAQEVSWSRTHKQLEAWLRPRPRITGSSAEKLARISGTSACWVQYITESTEGGAMYRSRERFSFFLANSHNRRGNSRPLPKVTRVSAARAVPARHGLLRCWSARLCRHAWNSIVASVPHFPQKDARVFLWPTWSTLPEFVQCHKQCHKVSERTSLTNRIPVIPALQSRFLHRG